MPYYFFTGGLGACGGADGFGACGGVVVTGFLLRSLKIFAKPAANADDTLIKSTSVYRYFI
jgi:hypothetical protein